MNFNPHSNLIGQHAFLGASNYYWLNYDDDKLISVYKNRLATARGTALHELAAQCIDLGVKLPRTRKTLNMYVNDAIGFMMTPEQVLYYSPYAFGTCDAISFRDNCLRIHDLKTGTTPASMQQLEIYAAFFCLEYNQKPGALNIILQLYQNDDVIVEEPDVDTISHIMDKIITFDKYISKIEKEA